MGSWYLTIITITIQYCFGGEVVWRLKRLNTVQRVVGVEAYLLHVWTLRLYFCFKSRIRIQSHSVSTEFFHEPGTLWKLFKKAVH